MAKRFLGIGWVCVLAVLAACSASNSAGDCTTLPTCCTQLTNSADKSECMQVVEIGDEASCGDAQSAFEVDNLCTVTDSIPPSGGAPGTSSGSGSGSSTDAG